MPDSREAAIAAGEAAEGSFSSIYFDDEEVAESVLDAAHAAGHIHFTDACDEQHDRWLDAEGELRGEIDRLNRELRGVRESLEERAAAADDATASAVVLAARLGQLERIVRDLGADYPTHVQLQDLHSRAREWVDQQEAST